MKHDLATEYFDGRWNVPEAEGPEPLACVSCREPATGAPDDWCWWALGEMGDASTYDAARAAAMSALERRGLCLTCKGRRKLIKSRAIGSGRDGERWIVPEWAKAWNDEHTCPTCDGRGMLLVALET